MIILNEYYYSWLQCCGNFVSFFKKKTKFAVFWDKYVDTGSIREMRRGHSQYCRLLYMRVMDTV